MSLWIVKVPCRIKHFESELNKSRGVIRSRHGHAAYNHVVIARSFDLLESVALNQPIKSGEDFIEESHKLDGRGGAGP
jgi:hypothetical protein